MKKAGLMVTGALGVVVMIIDSRTALSGASEGIRVCLEAVIPSLFPFLFFSMMLNAGLGNYELKCTGIERLLKLPQGGTQLLLTGLLGGYPVGAQGLAQAVSSGRLSRTDAERMLAFCNNCGPAFLFGMVARFFPDGWMIWVLWIIHILSALLVALIIPCKSGAFQKSHLSKVSAVSVLKQSISVMAQICGWVILFRMLITFLTHWFGFLISDSLRVALYGVLELSNGCMELGSVPDISTRFVLCSGMLAFGGICVLMQTFAVIDNSFSCSLYLPGKIIQGIFSVFLSSATVFLLEKQTVWAMTAAICGIFILIIIFFLRYRQKSSSILIPFGV